jgi:hypothetical protein
MEALMEGCRDGKIEWGRAFWCAEPKTECCALGIGPAVKPLAGGSVGMYAVRDKEQFRWREAGV